MARRRTKSGKFARVGGKKRKKRKSSKRRAAAHRMRRNAKGHFIGKKGGKKRKGGHKKGRKSSKRHGKRHVKRHGGRRSHMVAAAQGFAGLARAIEIQRKRNAAAAAGFVHRKKGPAALSPTQRAHLARLRKLHAARGGGKSPSGLPSWF